MHKLFRRPPFSCPCLGAWRVTDTLWVGDIVGPYLTVGNDGNSGAGALRFVGHEAIQLAGRTIAPDVRRDVCRLREV